MSSKKDQHGASPLSSQLKSRSAPGFLSSRELEFFAYVMNMDKHGLIKNNTEEYISNAFDDFRRKKSNPQQGNRYHAAHLEYLDISEKSDFNAHNSENDSAPSRFVCFFCMDIDLFEWIDTKNPRLCNFVWSYIRLITDDRNFNILFSSGLKKEMIVNPSIQDGKKPLHGSTIPYEKFQFETSPLNSDSQRNIIINYFNFLYLKKEDKKIMLEGIKSKWSECSKRMDVKNWLDINKNESWAWHYLHKESSPRWFVIHDKKTDIINGVITTFDLLNDLPDTRELLLTRMKLAWSQKAYRDKNNGKKTVSIVLPDDIINMLGFICTNTDRRKNEVVARLIRDEYEKVKKGGH